MQFCEPPDGGSVGELPEPGAVRVREETSGTELM